MKLTILGATGGIGGHLLTRALADGHEVRVLAREPDGLPAAVGLTVIRGSALDTAAVAEAIAGADAVLSALGPRGAKSPSLMAAAAASIVEGMARAGTRRFIGVSASGAYISGDPDMGALTKAIVPRLFATHFADIREMETTIRASDLDWTLVRATRLVNGPLTGHYRVRPDYPPARGRKISRADVAHFMDGVLPGNGWPRAAPALAY